MIWDSHAIAAYLVDKYGKDDAIYPKDLFTRARVNQRLFFEAGSLFPKIRAATYSIIFQGGSLPSQEVVDDFHKTFETLENTLQTSLYLVGDNWTIADVSVANSILVSATYAPLDADKYPKTVAWLERVDKNIPHFAEINGTFIQQFQEIVKATAEKNKTK